MNEMKYFCQLLEVRYMGLKWLNILKLIFNISCQNETQRILFNKTVNAYFPGIIIDFKDRNIIDFFINEMKVEPKLYPDNGEASLYISGRSGWFDIVKMLFNSLPKFDANEKKYATSALLGVVEAQTSKVTEMISYLMQKHGAEINKHVIENASEHNSYEKLLECVKWHKQNQEGKLIKFNSFLQLIQKRKKSLSSKNEELLLDNDESTVREDDLPAHPGILRRALD